MDSELVVQRTPLFIALVMLTPAFAGCSGSDASESRTAPVARQSRDARPDGLFRDFLDGKFDGAGHPINAEVWQAEDGCKAETGKSEAEGRAFRPDAHDAGLVCVGSSGALGLGHFTLNVRALAFAACSDAECDAPALTLTVKNADGSEIDSKTFNAGSFAKPLTYQNLALSFSHSASGPISIQLNWHGKVGIRVDYVELFRSSRNVLVTPPSGVYDANANFLIEVQDPPNGFSLKVDCGGTDLSKIVETLLASGEAKREDTEFRSSFNIPAGKLAASCALPARIRFQLAESSWVDATSRVSLYAEEPPCTFAPNTTRVLLTGFEPFPADSNHDNSSEQAVRAFDPASVPGISLMTVILPVEFDTAPGIVTSAIERCAPDVVVGFGQGRSQVDLETTAYNLEDSSDVAGGVPDNRGLIPGGVAIEDGGPAERRTLLPAGNIVKNLGEAGISSGLSDDPGRYVCNDVFYNIVRASADTTRVGGFVHLPYIYTVGVSDREMLAKVVTEVVSQAVAKQRGQ